MGVRFRVVWLYSILFVFALGIASIGCKDAGEPPSDVVNNGEEEDDPTILLHGKVAAIEGVNIADYHVFGELEDAQDVSSDGAFEVEVSSVRPVIIFAGPREDSETEMQLGPEAGLLMAPYLGSSFRIITDGGRDFFVSNQGDILLNGVSTIISLVLMHPALAHPGVDEQRARVQRMFDLVYEGKLDLRAAGQAWEDAIAQNRPFDEDERILEHLTEIIDVLLDDQEFSEDDFYEMIDSQLRLQPLGRGIFEVGRAGIAVSNLEITREDHRLLLEASTALGTGLDYLYFVHPLEPATFPHWPYHSTTTDADIMTVYPRTGVQHAVGIAPGSSYWSYLDVIGNAMKWVSGAVGGVTVERQNKLTLPFPDEGEAFYELRLYSGGLGYGNDYELYNLVQEHYGDEANAAAMQNMAMAIVEVLGVIPGGDTLVGDAAGRKIIQAGAQQILLEVNTLVTQVGISNVRGADIYDLLYNTTKAVIDAYLAEASKSVKRRGIIRLVSWVGKGGRKAVRAVLNVPGRVASGGSLANRAYRFARPDSIVESYVIGVGRSEDDAIAFWGNNSDELLPPRNYEGDPITWSNSLQGSLRGHETVRYRVQERVGGDLHLAVGVETEGEVIVKYTYDVQFHAPPIVIWEDEAYGNTIKYEFGAFGVTTHHILENPDGSPAHTYEVEYGESSVTITGEARFDSRKHFDDHRIGTELGVFDVFRYYTRTTAEAGKEPVEETFEYNFGRFNSIVWWDPNHAQDLD